MLLRSMNKNRLLLIVSILIVVLLFFAFDIHQYLNLDYIKSQKSVLDDYRLTHPFKSALIFFLFFVLITSISLPGAGVLSLTAGTLFGLIWGTIISSFAAMIGATNALLITRYILRDIIQQKYESKLKPVNDGIEKNGKLYLFTMRMIPVFPYFIINALMGLTHIKAISFAWVTQLGMLLPTIILVNAGTQLATINSLYDVFSIKIIFSFALLGLFPILTKKTMDIFKAKNNSS